MLKALSVDTEQVYYTVACMCGYFGFRLPLCNSFDEHMSSSSTFIILLERFVRVNGIRELIASFAARSVVFNSSLVKGSGYAIISLVMFCAISLPTSSPEIFRRFWYAFSWRPFTGRVSELDGLHELLQRGHSPVSPMTSLLHLCGDAARCPRARSRISIL